VSGTESISRWILWIDVLWAMISSTAGGPSLSQPWRTALKREFKACFSGEGQVFHKNYLHTLCNASTCRSWKRDDSNLMAWFASTTDRTPNPWCLQKNKRYIIIAGGKKKADWVRWLRNCFAKLKKKRWLIFFSRIKTWISWRLEQDSIVIVCSAQVRWTMITPMGSLHTLFQVPVWETQRPPSSEQ